MFHCFLLPFFTSCSAITSLCCVVMCPPTQWGLLCLIQSATHGVGLVIFNVASFAVITRCKYFDPCYARATVVRARFLAAAFSDGSYLAHVKTLYCMIYFWLVKKKNLLLHISHKKFGKN